MSVWEVTPDYPEGHYRPLTPAEQAQQAVDLPQWQAASQAAAVAAGNEAALLAKSAQAIDQLETAASNWGTLTAGQKDAAVLLNIRVTGRLARIVASRLDAAP